MDVSSGLFVEELVQFQGVTLTKSVVDNWARVEVFQAKPDDVLIATYPKAGTTWISEIVDMVYNDGDVEKCRRDAIYNRVPYMEISHPGLTAGVDQLAAMPSPRLIKTHLPIQLLPESFWENNCKIIYMARNAKDVAVSFYFFHQIVKSVPSPGTWEEFLKKYMAGEVSYGFWSDHVKGWWEKKESHPILYLFYEDMKEDPMREIRNIAQFLEKDLSEEVLEKIVHHTAFNVMKDNSMANYKTIPEWFIDQSVTPFMRKGIAGDWKNHFTVSQNERFEQDYGRKMAESSLRFRSEI